MKKTKKAKLTVEINEEDFLRYSVEGDDPHTLYNILRTLLLESPDVKLAGYTRTRTFREKIMFQLRTINGVKPIDILIQKCQELKALSDEFINKFENALNN